MVIPITLTNAGTAPAEQIELSGTVPPGWKINFVADDDGNGKSVDLDDLSPEARAKDRKRIEKEIKAEAKRQTKKLEAKHPGKLFP